MSEFSAKFSDRPTIGYLKKVLSAFDEKIVRLNEQLKLHIDLMERTQHDQDREIQNLGGELTVNNKELNLKPDKEDLQEIWEHFERFALYEDLKSLNTKVLPEIAKFEQKIINFDGDLEKKSLMIRQFDQTLS